MKYPFKGVGDDRKGPAQDILPKGREKYREREGIQLSKRLPEVNDLETTFHFAQDSSEKMVGGLAALNSNAPTGAAHAPISTVLSSKANQKLTLDPDRSPTTSTFLSNLDSLAAEILSPLNRDSGKEEDAVNLTILREIVAKYKGGSAGDQNDIIGTCLRNKYGNGQIDSQIKGIRFKDKHSDMIMVTLKQMGDQLLETLLTPTGSNSASGAQLSNLINYLTKTVLLQARLSRSLVTMEPAADLSIPLVTSESLPTLRLLVDVLLTVLFAEAHRPTVAPQPAAASAFQLHSQRSQPGHDKNDLLIQPGDSVGGGWLDKAVLSLARSSQFKRLSFEGINNSVGDLPPNELTDALRESGTNMNMFVQTLLHKQ